MGEFLIYSGFIFSAIAVIPVLLVFGLVIVLALRADGDDQGRRAYAVYCSMAAFVAVFTLLFGTFGIVSSVVALATNDDASELVDDSAGSDDFEDFDDFGIDVRSADDRAYDSLALSVVVSAVAGAVWLFHQRRLDAVAPTGERSSAQGRVGHAHRLVVSFVCVVIILATAALSLYGVFQAAAPGITGRADRGDALADVVRVAYLGAASFFLFARHFRGAELAPPPPPAPAAAAA